MLDTKETLELSEIKFGSRLDNLNLEEFDERL